MQIIPAIDIINGRCVRLSQGDYAKEKIYYEDPLDAAKAFEDAGLQRVHLVDLDGARAGSIQNLKTLESIASSTKLVIDFGGGVKSINDISTVFSAGASIVTLGSVAVLHPQLIEEWIIEFGAEKLLIGADVMNEQIKISGWLIDGGLSVFDFISKMLAAGVQYIFCTDISKDGMLKGPSIDLYRKILSQFPALNLIASGGVSTMEEVKVLKQTGCTGAIIGKGIYEGKLALSELSAIQC